MLQKINLSSQNKILIISFSIFTILYIIINFNNSKSSNTQDQKIETADTLIPKGQVLVPIELANISSVASLVDRYGVIDLFAGEDNQSSLIAKKIKILRAPLNPSQFAVLVSEEMSQKIMKTKGPFWGVIQNRRINSDKEPTDFKKGNQSEIEIEYQPSPAS